MKTQSGSGERCPLKAPFPPGYGVRLTAAGHKDFCQLLDFSSEHVVKEPRLGVETPGFLCPERLCVLGPDTSPFWVSVSSSRK